MNDLLGNWLVLCGGALLVVLLLAPLAAKLTAWSYRRKFGKQTTIIAEYSAPDDLLPHELGYLYDNSFGDNELLAVILELHRKNAVIINFPKAGGMTILVNDITKELRRTMSGAELAVYGALEEGRGVATDWRRISSRISESVGTQAIFETSVFQDLQSKGYLNTSSIFSASRERATAVKWVSLLLVVAIFSLPVYAEFYATTGNALSAYESLDRSVSWLPILLLLLLCWPLMYWYCNLVSGLYFRSAGIPKGSTRKLRQVWPAIVGFREFIRIVEYERVRADTRLEDPALSYCVAFGLPVTPGSKQ